MLWGYDARPVPEALRLVHQGDDEPTGGDTAVTFDEAAVREETAEVVRGAAEAISAGDEEAFLDRVDSSLKAQIEGDLDLSSPRAAELAQALNNAEPVDVQPDIVFFELTADSETYSFYVLREGGEWKLGGL
jgi:hypothetical protein